MMLKNKTNLSANVMVIAQGVDDKLQYYFGPQKLKDNRYLFRLWAPDSKKVNLHLYKNEDFIEIPMNKTKDDFFEVITDKAQEGSGYLFHVDNHICVPDPASRAQFDSVHGLSVVTSNEFDWEADEKWNGKPFEESVFYELHVGTFTPEGTFKAAVEKFDYLKELGINAIELMPINDFPGRFGWGYDGVLIFAPASKYGTPEDLKYFIKEAHKRDIMVVLDVVYNHFGPDGNYLHVYAESEFFNQEIKTPWGHSINFENPFVRRFYIENALYWLEEFHFDGLRIDAVHEIYDNSQKHILRELSRFAHERFENKRKIHLILENGKNQSHYFSNTQEYNDSFDAQWNDDFHHGVHVCLTREDEGYYQSYNSRLTGKSPAYFLARSLTEGFSYQGNSSDYNQKSDRGEVSRGLCGSHFINFIQNHDQIGNRAFGDRLVSITGVKCAKIAAALCLLSPFVPLIFMGEEWASTSAFLFFCELNEQLNPSIREGRRNEFAGFSSFSDEKVRHLIPDPTDIKTFNRSKLNWNEVVQEPHSEIFYFYKKLIEIRKRYITPMIKIINPSENNYKIFNDYSFLVSYTVEGSNGYKLDLLVNLSDKNIEIPLENYSELIFEYPENSLKSLQKDSLLPSFSAIWVKKEIN